MEPESLLAGHPVAEATYRIVRAQLEALGPVTVRTTKSQVAFWRRHGFAYLWLPGQYLRHPGAEVVLAIALGRHDPSNRFKQVSHPSPGQWMHHLEVHAVDELDAEVAGWLTEAAARAG